MVVTIQKIRNQINDTISPYSYTDQDIQSEIDAATEIVPLLEGITLGSDAVSERIIVLKTSITIKSRDSGKNVGREGIVSIKDGTSTIKYSEQGQTKIDRWTSEYRDLVESKMDTIIEFIHDNY